MTEDIVKIVAAHKTDACEGCDKCMKVCPVRAEDKRFSPSKLVSACKKGKEPKPSDPTLWGCTLCRACTVPCPVAGVDFPGFVLALRAEQFKGIEQARPAHHGAFQLLTSPPLKAERKPDRCFWVPEGRKGTDPSSLFLQGCLPVLDRMFAEDLGYGPAGAAQGALKLLDSAGISPMVSPDEPCCGAELYFLGDREGFEQLAGRMAEFVAARGAKRLIALCPQCAWMLREVYPAGGFKLKPEVRTAVEALSDSGNGLSFSPRQLKAGLYHWPSKEEEHQAVLKLLAGVPGLSVQTPKPEVSTGLSGFHHCNKGARKIQAASLKRVAGQGASLLLSTVPRDTIHLRCAIRPSSWQPGLIETRDLFEFVGEALLSVVSR